MVNKEQGRRKNENSGMFVVVCLLLVACCYLVHPTAAAERPRAELDAKLEAKSAKRMNLKKTPRSRRRWKVA